MLIIPLEVRDFKLDNNYEIDLAIAKFEVKKRER